MLSRCYHHQPLISDPLYRHAYLNTTLRNCLTCPVANEWPALPVPLRVHGSYVPHLLCRRIDPHARATRLPRLLRTCHATPRSRLATFRSCRLPTCSLAYRYTYNRVKCMHAKLQKKAPLIIKCRPELSNAEMETTHL